jgi:hypothetical protein
VSETTYHRDTLTCRNGWLHIYFHIYLYECRIMGQVTIYLNDDAEATARAAARAEGVSLSKWVSGRIGRGARVEWPAVVRQLAGAWSDLPSAEQLRRSQGKDVARRRL